MTIFFFRSGLKTGATGENMSPPTTGFQNGQQWSGVSVRKHHVLSFLSERDDCMHSRHACRTFRANIRRSDCAGPTLTHIYRSKLILY